MQVAQATILPTEELTEDHLRREIAYCKARLADIQNAPPHSRHREGLMHAANRLRECEHRLTRLRARGGATPYHH